MKGMIDRHWIAGLLVLPSMVFIASAQAGPVMLVGDAADDHAAHSAYAGLLQHVLDNVTNLQSGILAVGVDPGSDAAAWITEVSSQLSDPQPITFVNDVTISVLGLSGYAVIYVPSDSQNTAGGISASENNRLIDRAADVAAFLNGGGGLFGLTQGQLEDAYGYLGEFASVETIDVPPSGLCNPEQLFDDVSATSLGEDFGITDTSLDGCCWHGVFTSFPEELAALARANEPGCPDINGKAAILAGFVTIDFDAPSEFPAEGEPNVEAVGDLNGDATNDVVVTIPGDDPMSDGSVQVFLNQGTDEFGAWLGLVPIDPFPVGNEPSSVAVGLLNNDLHLDLAVTCAGNNAVSVFFNQGDATFVLSQEIGVGNRPSSVITGDFNMDLSVDLAVANEEDNNVTLLFNDGTGGFPEGGLLPGGDQPPTGGEGPLQLEPEDVDNDKDLDMGGINNGGEFAQPGEPGSIFLLLNQGDGTFAPAVNIEIGVDPRDLSIADVNRDGAADIVAVNAADATVSVLINQGDGTYVVELELEVGGNPLSIDAVDLDGDLDPDLAVVAEDPELGPAVQVLVNLLGERLMFGPPIGFSVDADPKFVVGGRMNDDDLSDVVTANADDGPSGGSVTVLLNSPSPVEGDLVAAVDIKPGACPNPFNRSSHGVLPVALVGTDDLAASDVDISSLRISRADGVGGSAAPNEGPPGPHTEIRDVATPFGGEPCDCHHLGGDDVLDVFMKFRSDDVVEALELDDLPGGADVELVVSGTLLDGTLFEGRDCIRLVPPGVAPGLLAVGSNAPGVFIEVNPLDEQVDGGGFGAFERSFPPGTVVTLSAPMTHEEWRFVGWASAGLGSLVNGGGPLPQGRSIVMTVGDEQWAQAIYMPYVPNDHDY
ncbi:MAG: FG-GAP repeat domain-containing protein [Planctomycetota bacterium]|jgi:hypothetical protein